MSKIICDICGTTYPDTADCCPICGCSKDAAAEFLGEEITVDDVTRDTVKEPRGNLFAPKKNKEIFDFDAVNDDSDAESMDDLLGEDDLLEDEAEDEDDAEPADEEKGGHSGFTVFILTVLILALLAAAGFVFVRYFLPNWKGTEDVPATTQPVRETLAAPTEETGIPCQILILTSGTAELSKEGQMFLLHVQPTPEDTTDVITYSSADESIATVTADGKVTAVSEGETVIYISCGSIQTTCPVVVKYEEETVPTTEATVPAPQETTPAEIAPQETEATQPSSQNSGLKNVTLKLKKTDIRLGVYYEYQLLLDCDLEQNEVEWRSEHPHIATVDENGVIKAVKDGTTSIIAKYGDQEVSCIVRCSY